MALSSTQNSDALHVLHRILLQARLLAGTGSEARKIVSIMDDAEYLVSLMMQPDNRDERFRQCLADMERKHPEMAGLARAFEERPKAEQKAA